MSRVTLAIAAAFLFSAPCLALAQNYPLAPAPLPPTAAGRPSLTSIFQWLDTNHDGFLTLQEFLAAPWVKNKAKAAEFFSWMDTNHDGRVSLPEFLAAYKLYSGPSGYTVRTTYPWALAYWRPWRYGWSWHAAGWHPGWTGGWAYAAPKAHTHAVVVNHRAGHPYHVAKHASGKGHKGKGHKSTGHKGHVGKHPKHHAKHAKGHKGKHHGHKGHAHKGHGHKAGHKHH
jgi:EF-hand domain pair